MLVATARCWLLYLQHDKEPIVTISLPKRILIITKHKLIWLNNIRVLTEKSLRRILIFCGRGCFPLRTISKARIFDRAGRRLESFAYLPNSCIKGCLVTFKQFILILDFQLISLNKDMFSLSAGFVGFTRLFRSFRKWPREDCKRLGTTAVWYSGRERKKINENTKRQRSTLRGSIKGISKPPIDRLALQGG